VILIAHQAKGHHEWNREPPRRCLVSRERRSAIVHGLRCRKSASRRAGLSWGGSPPSSGAGRRSGRAPFEAGRREVLRHPKGPPRSAARPRAGPPGPHTTKPHLPNPPTQSTDPIHQPNPPPQSTNPIHQPSNTLHPRPLRRPSHRPYHSQATGDPHQQPAKPGA
jgi:hypothetical protein